MQNVSENIHSHLKDKCRLLIFFLVFNQFLFKNIILFASHQHGDLLNATHLGTYLDKGQFVCHTQDRLSDLFTENIFLLISKLVQLHLMKFREEIILVVLLIFRVLAVKLF